MKKEFKEANPNIKYNDKINNKIEKLILKYNKI